MKIISLAQLALTSGTFFINRASAAQCNNDGCLRALNPTGRHLTAAIVQASAFCSTFTSSTIKSYAFPTHATSACGQDVQRYSSACSCAFPLDKATDTPTFITATATATATNTANPGTATVPTDRGITETDVRTPTATSTSTPLPPSNCQKGNLVVNGDFEYNEEQTPPKGWKVVSANAPYAPLYSAYSSPGIAYTGGAAARLSVDALRWYRNQSFSETRMIQKVNLAPGVTSVLQSQYYSQHRDYPGQPIYPGKFWAKIDGKFVLESALGKLPFDQWNAASFEIEKGNPNKAVEIEFGVRADAGQYAEVYVDSIWAQDKKKQNPCVPNSK